MSLHRITLTVILAFALALTLSCGNHNWEDWFNNDSSSSEEDAEGDSSSSRGGGSSSSGGNVCTKPGDICYDSRSSSSSRGSSVIAGGSCDIKDYEAVKIGNRTWMAENYNCKVEGSHCYGEDGRVKQGTDDYKVLTDAEVQTNCKKYGRLYEYTAAMALPEGCNANKCYEQIEDPHRGICPSGWHIPSEDDWDDLAIAIGGYQIMGRDLKAKEGWDDCGPSGSGKKYLCEDKFKFSALPGGSGFDWAWGNSDPIMALLGISYADNIGEVGEWWSTDGYHTGIFNNYENALYSWDTMFHSVRCVKD
jgi:uncharacterized protein (TIGR02145 family)